MQKKSPSFLRIHSADNEPASTFGCPATCDNILEAFTDATGWQVRKRGGSPHSLEPAGFFNLGTGTGDLRNRLQLVHTHPVDGLLDESDYLMGTSVSEDTAWRMLESIDDLKSRLHAAERVIAKQEAELAAGIGVSLRGDESEILCDRLQESMQRAANASGSDAAAVYLLDEQTSTLKMRACWGMPISVLAKPARQLRGSMADLEALLGNAVLLENIALAPEWNSPENFTAGLCVPIGSPHMPQGTLWMWSDHIRDFSTADIEAAKTAADRILSDVERSVLGAEVIRSRSLCKQLDAASLVQSSRLPDRQKLHADYDIDGWTYQAGPLGGNFHNWNLNTQGQICAAIGDCFATGAAGAIVAASLQTIVEACWNTRHNAGQLVRKANEIACGHADSDWRSSLVYFQLEPETGAIQIASAGAMQTFALGQRGFRLIASSGPAIALQPDATYRTERLVLEPGEILLLASPDLIGGINRGGFTQEALLALVYSMLEEPASEIASTVARRLPTLQGDSAPLFDRSLLIIRRSSIA